MITVENVSRYIIAKPVKSIGFGETAKVLLEDVILKFGSFKYLTSAQASTATSKVFTKINKLMAFKRRFTTAYHPQCNALDERMMSK